MSAGLKIDIDVKGLTAAASDLQTLRNELADRRRLHARMAVDAQGFIREYLNRDQNHNTASKLGASPTGHRAKSGLGIEADSNDACALLRIPRNTGLGRAFHDVVIVMKTKMLTIPACARTYGRSARDFAEGVLKFSVVQGRFPALVFADTGETGFWLARKVRQNKDRTLLPSDESLTEIGARSARAYLTNILRETQTA